MKYLLDWGLKTLPISLEYLKTKPLYLLPVLEESTEIGNKSPINTFAFRSIFV